MCMKNGIEIKNIEVTLSIADVFDKEDYLPQGYQYVCKNGLEIYYGFSDEDYQSIMPFITGAVVWFPYGKEEITDTTIALNDYYARKMFYEDWEEFYNYLKERHEKKKIVETTETTKPVGSIETIETFLYNINYTTKNYTKKGNYITNITLTLDPSLFWEEPPTDVSNMIDFTGAYGWTFFYNTNPETIPCILPGHIKEVWFSGNEDIIPCTPTCKMSEKEFEEFVMDVDSFVCDLTTKGKLRKSCGEHLIMKQYPTINSTEIVTKFTFTLPKKVENLENNTYHIGDWTFFVARNEDQSAVSFSTKSVLLCFSDDNEATCAYISKEVPQVSELEIAYNDFLREVMTTRE